MGMPNDHLADQLAEVAALLRAAKGERFRVRAYERAARMIRAAPVDLTAMPAEEVRRLEGVGEAIGGLIAEYRTTGGIGMLEQLRQDEPPGVGALLRLPLIGVRDARALATAGFTDIGALRQAAARPGGLARVDERLAARVRESLRRWNTSVDSHAPLPLARRDAAHMATRLAELPAVDHVEVAGAVRRGADTVEHFDLLIAARDLVAAERAVSGSSAVVRVLERSPRHADVMLASGRAARLWFAPPAAAGAALVYATGAAGHVAELEARAREHGLRLRPDGVWRNGDRVAGDDEEGVYAALDLAFVAPELREGAGELAAVATGELPALVGDSDLCGDLHVHSDWSRDGKASLDDMVAAAAARGYDYVAITDHAENLRINGMSRETVLARREAIAELRDGYPELRILDGAELNIALDGTLDYDLEFLLDFDLGVASIHSHMDRLAPVQTDRLLSAIAHPAVHVIGHPTGRIIGHRPGYGIEMEAIAQAAAETGTALEVNGSARRLDLSGDMVCIALRAGALVSLSSDAHSVAELDAIGNAVPTARRGWATPADVLNSRTGEQLLAWIRGKRDRVGTS